MSFQGVLSEGESLLMSQPSALWAAGFTRRWHMNAAMSREDDYICAHQGRCAVLVISLFPDHSLALLRAVVTHDLAEFHVGDLSRPFKDCGGDLVEAHAALEARMLAGMGCEPSLDDGDLARLKFVDRLDAYLFVALRNPAEADRNGWRAERDWLYAEASRLGCDLPVKGLIWDVRYGGLE